MDMGADANFIDVETAKLLGCHIKKYSGQPFDSASGDEIIPNGEVQLTFWSPGSNLHLYHEKFLTMKRCPYSIILGVKFLETSRWILKNPDFFVLAHRKQSPSKIL